MAIYLLLSPLSQGFVLLSLTCRLRLEWENEDAPLPRHSGKTLQKVRLRFGIPAPL
jgi:hypothetical protein